MITGLNHITLAVCDVECAFEFYCEILGFEPAAKWDKGAYLESGDLWLALLKDDRISGSPRPDYTHVAFSCPESEFETLKLKLEKGGFPAWQDNSSEGDSYYFCDPDGHKLEIHVGSLESRIRSMKKTPWAEFKFYD